MPVSNKKKVGAAEKNPVAANVTQMPFSSDPISDRAPIIPARQSVKAESLALRRYNHTQVYQVGGIPDPDLHACSVSDHSYVRVPSYTCMLLEPPTCLQLTRRIIM